MWAIVKSRDMGIEFSEIIVKRVGMVTGRGLWVGCRRRVRVWEGKDHGSMVVGNGLY